MSELVTDEALEAAARALHGAETPREWGDTPVGYRELTRDSARAALEAAAPLIAAKAWDEGYAMSERELDHAYGGHPISPGDLCHECGTGNPYARKEGQ